MGLQLRMGISVGEGFADSSIEIAGGDLLCVLALTGVATAATIQGLVCGIVCGGDQSAHVHLCMWHLVWLVAVGRR
jgi:hypothetical protein